MMSNTSRRQRLVLLSTAVLAVTACGGGGDSPPSNTPAPPPATIPAPSTVSGIVLLPIAAPGAPAQAPAMVCYDSNRNGTCETGEPVTTTDSAGAYTLTSLPTQQPVNAALVAQRQNEEMTRLTQASYAQGEQVKRISSWAAILFAPTVIASIYGMNFTHIPELEWQLGYPFAILLMLLGLGLGLYAIFKRRGWL